MIVDRDQEMVKDYFEIYKYATIAQLEKIFFREQDYSYNICRRRLNELVKHDYIKVFKDTETNHNIYVINEKNIKPPSLHRMIVLDVYAELKYQGFKIFNFEIEKQWVGGKYRSDAFIQIGAKNLTGDKGKKLYFYLEVMLSNNYHYLDKYDDPQLINEVKEYVKNNAEHFPRVLLVNNRESPSIKLKSTSVLQLDTKLNSFASILLQ